MRTKAGEWFICKVRYEKTMENGLQKKVTEAYVVDAISFTEAEARITEEMAAYISGEFEVVDISRTAFHEIFFMDEGEKMLGNQTEDLRKAIQKKDPALGNEVYNRSLEDMMKNTDSRWYKSRLQFVTLDEKTGKEKRSAVTYLVEGCSLEDARRNIDAVMGQTMNDYVIVSVSETAIMDVFEYKANQAESEK